jgi:hypothetical protein
MDRIIGGITRSVKEFAKKLAMCFIGQIRALSYNGVTSLNTIVYQK